MIRRKYLAVQWSFVLFHFFVLSELSPCLFFFPIFSLFFFFCHCIINFLLQSHCLLVLSFAEYIKNIWMSSFSVIKKGVTMSVGLSKGGILVVFCCCCLKPHKGFCYYAFSFSILSKCKLIIQFWAL